jgi:signal transduction histidine kinase
MERQLSRTQEQLLQSEKLAAMGRLTSQLAHELNNPLYGIMNTLELMKTEIRPDNKRRRLLDMSLSETMRLADMLRKMLSFSKPDQEERRLWISTPSWTRSCCCMISSCAKWTSKCNSPWARDCGRLWLPKISCARCFSTWFPMPRMPCPAAAF